MRQDTECAVGNGKDVKDTWIIVEDNRHTTPTSLGVVQHRFHGSTGVNTIIVSDVALATPSPGPRATPISQLIRRGDLSKALRAH